MLADGLLRRDEFRLERLELLLALRERRDGERPGGVVLGRLTDQGVGVSKGFGRFLSQALGLVKDRLVRRDRELDVGPRRDLLDDVA